MIVEMTSETPRNTRSSAAIAAQPAPASMAMTMATTVFSQPDNQPVPAKAAAAKTPMRYWLSTPMLNRFILNPIAAATPER